jgi:hypothetical protein
MTARYQLLSAVRRLPKAAEDPTQWNAAGPTGSTIFVRCLPCGAVRNSCDARMLDPSSRANRICADGTLGNSGVRMF